MIDERDDIGARYLAHLTEPDLRTLVHADAVPSGEASARVTALRGSPGLVLDVLDRPNTSAALLNLVADRTITFISPFLLFAAAIHRTAHDLASSSYTPERAAPRMRVPVFDTGQLSGYLAAPTHRLFLAELLTRFARTASGVTFERTPHGLRRRRWNSLDAVSLARMLDGATPAQRSGIWLRLGDLSLFLAGVFPDAAGSAFGRVDPSRLALMSGVSADVDSTNPADVLEWLGARWYRMATATIPAIVPALPDSAEEFHRARRVLNAASDRYLFPFAADWFNRPQVPI